MSEKKSYYITTAIVYSSGKPHIGNTYEIVLADAIARFRRYEGYDVFFQTGTDEHGQKIENKAKEAGITPQEYVDNVLVDIKNIWDIMNISYDKFIRTTDYYHEAQIQKIFKKLYEKGDIYKGEYEGYYCTYCESFFSKSALIDGKCPDCGREVPKAKEEAYFFKMSKYQDKLEEYIKNNPDFIQPESRKNEMINNFIKPGLTDLCVSRSSFKWGIPVDFDPNHVVYVWLDALSNYITGIGYDALGNSSETFNKYWPCNLHLIGKDIVRFHTIYWPIFLMALDLPLPKKVFGHPWLLQEGGKMSKSKGNVLYADELVEAFGVDAVRYFVLHEMPFEHDGIISLELMTERYNNELANILGNLVNRTVAMINKYFDGKVKNTNTIESIDKGLIEHITSLKCEVTKNMENLHVADAITCIFNSYRRLNKYIDETMPWILAKDESKSERLEQVLYNLSEGIVITTSLLSSFMPNVSDKIFKNFNVSLRKYDTLENFGLLNEYEVINGEIDLLFNKIEEKDIISKFEVESNNDSYKNESESNINVIHKDEVDFSDFEKLEFRVGKILECKRVEKSKKLLCSKVKIGNETRQIVSGIAKYYSPEEMIGKSVMVACNLKPITLAGLVSEGMILCASDEDGNCVIVSAEKDISSGSEIS